MSTIAKGEPHKALAGETRTAAVLIVRMGEPAEGAVAGRVPLEQRQRFMAGAVKAIRDNDGTATHGMGDGLIACFEGPPACAQALLATVVILETVANRRAADPAFPSASLALDYGAVSFLRYGTGLPLDVQGDAADRCRQLAQAVPAGAALATAAYRDQLSVRDEWKALPKVPMAALQGQRIFQLRGHGGPFRWKPTIVVEAERFDKLRDQLDDSQYRLARKDAQIARLEQLMREITGDIDAATGEFTQVLTDPKTEELRRLTGDLRRAELAAWVPLLAERAAGYQARLAKEQRMAKLAADLQERYPELDWSDVGFWVRLLAIPTSDEEPSS